MPRAPAYVADAAAAVRVSAGDSHSMYLNWNHTVSTWGKSSYGRLGRQPGEAGYEGVEQLAQPTYVVDISAGYDHSMALEYNGNLHTWGNNRSGQLGLGNSEQALDSYAPTQNERYLTDAGVEVTSISAGGGYGVIADRSGQI